MGRSTSKRKMQPKILVFNVGSSSIKFGLYQNNNFITKGKVERINEKECSLTIPGVQKFLGKSNYKEALKHILDIIKDFDIIAHRVVHGGKLSKTSLINKYVKKMIKQYSKYAPLHDIPELNVIETCEKLKKKQYAVFDTSFFSDLPDKANVYPVPLKLAKKYNIQRFGFHGNSHKYVTKGLKGKTVSCHLGNGCSVAAVINGKPIDTSMGLTPLEGLMMASRPGDIDPGIVLTLMKHKVDVEKMLNFNSGFKAFSNFTDMRDILQHIKNPKIKLAYDIFIYRVTKYIGAYAAAMSGIDNLVFTGGIGENLEKVRKDITKNLKFLRFKTIVKKTDEEKIIAEEAERANKK